MMEVILSPAALRDLDEIWMRIAVDNFDAAERLIERIEKSVQKLSRFPGAGHQRHDVQDKS